MKTRLLLTIVFIGLVLPEVYAQRDKLTLHLNNRPITEALNEIQRASGYNILYSNDIVSDTMLISVSATNKPLSTVLRDILSPNRLFFMQLTDNMIVIGSEQLRKNGIMSSFASSNLNGQIFDSDGKPILFASVSLIKNKPSLIGVAADEFGRFEFTFPFQNDTIYKLEISSVGYEPKAILFTYPNTNELKHIELIKVKNVLENIKVNAERPTIERKIDRLVFNVSKSAGFYMNAAEALEKTPLVNVAENGISIIGKSGVIVMVNEREIKLTGKDILDYLKSLPSGNIDRIEIITAPPSKYEASGNSGLINIVLKETKNRTDYWSASINSGVNIAKKITNFNGISFSLNKKKWSVYSSLNNSTGTSLYRTEDGTILYKNNFSVKSYSILHTKLGANLSGYFNTSYKVNKKLTLGSQYAFSYLETPNTESNITTILSGQIIDSTINTRAEKQSLRRFNSLNVNADYKFDSLGKRLSANLDWFENYNNDDRMFQSNTLYPNLSTEDLYYASNGAGGIINNYSFKVDMEHPIKKIKLTYGAKISGTKNKSSSYFIDGQVNQNDKFRYSEFYKAAYISANTDLTKKLSTQVGFRFESNIGNGYSYTLNQDISNTNNKLFPTVYLLYKLDKTKSMSFSYGKRITRPGFYSLNPFVRYINRLHTSEGNPFLVPYYTDNIQLNYTANRNLNVSLYGGISKNIFEQVSFLDDNGITNRTKRLNFFDKYNIGANCIYLFNSIKWLESLNTLVFYYDYYKMNISKLQPLTKQLSGSITTNNDIFIDKKKDFIFNVYFTYRLPSYYTIYKMSSSNFLSLGMRINLFDKKMQISLLGTDLLKGSIMKNTSSYNNNILMFNNYEDRRAIRLQVRYTFGNNKLQSNQAKIGNQDEKNRL